MTMNTPRPSSTSPAHQAAADKAMGANKQNNTNAASTIAQKTTKTPFNPGSLKK